MAKNSIARNSVTPNYMFTRYHRCNSVVVVSSSTIDNIHYHLHDFNNPQTTALLCPSLTMSMTMMMALTMTTMTTMTTTRATVFTKLSSILLILLLMTSGHRDVYNYNHQHRHRFNNDVVVPVGVVFVDALLLDQYDYLQSVCVETLPNDDFVCTHTSDVLELREKMYSRLSAADDDGHNNNNDDDENTLPLINVGVTQRGDGAEHERKAIRDVIRQMDMYFFEEVLAFPEYSYARTRWYVLRLRALRLCVCVCVCVGLSGDVSHTPFSSLRSFFILCPRFSGLVFFNAFAMLLPRLIRFV